MVPKISILALALTISAGPVLGAGQQEMEAAAKSGKVSFILVYDRTAVQLDWARQLIADAMKQVSGTVMIEVDRSAVANAEFVAKYRLSSAPVPLILVTSSTGIITRGIDAQQATVDQLVKMVPSPKKSKIIKALSEGNSVFITAYRKDMKSLEAVTNACATACKQMDGKSVHIKINMDDPMEANFLTEMKVNKSSTEPVTLVANPQGQISGIYTGVMQAGDLVIAAAKKVGGCCPSTVSNPNSSCDPKKK